MTTLITNGAWISKARSSVVHNHSLGVSMRETRGIRATTL